MMWSVPHVTMGWHLRNRELKKIFLSFNHPLHSFGHNYWNFTSMSYFHNLQHSWLIVIYFTIQCLPELNRSSWVLYTDLEDNPGQYHVGGEIFKMFRNHLEHILGWLDKWWPSSFLLLLCVKTLEGMLLLLLSCSIQSLPQKYVWRGL